MRVSFKEYFPNCKLPLYHGDVPIMSAACKNLLDALRVWYAVEEGLKPEEVNPSGVYLSGSLPSHEFELERYEDLIQYGKSLSKVEQSPSGEECLVWTPDYGYSVYPEVMTSHEVVDQSSVVFSIIAQSILQGKSLSVYIEYESKWRDNLVSALVAARVMGYDFGLSVSGTSENEINYIIDYRYTQYFTKGSEDVLTFLTNDEMRDELDSMGYRIGGLYALARRKSGRSKTRTQSESISMLSKRPDDEQVMPVILDDISATGIRVRVLPRILPYAQSLDMFRSLDEERRGSSSDLLRRQVHCHTENIPFRDFYIEGSQVTNSSYSLGRISNMAPAEFPVVVWVSPEDAAADIDDAYGGDDAVYGGDDAVYGGDDAAYGADDEDSLGSNDTRELRSGEYVAGNNYVFDVNGVAKTVYLTDYELIRTALQQRNFPMDYESSDKEYGYTPQWFMTSIPEVSYRKVGYSHIDPRFMSDEYNTVDSTDGVSGQANTSAPAQEDYTFAYDSGYIEDDDQMSANDQYSKDSDIESAPSTLSSFDPGQYDYMSYSDDEDGYYGGDTTDPWGDETSLWDEDENADEGDGF